MQVFNKESTKEKRRELKKESEDLKKGLKDWINNKENQGLKNEIKENLVTCAMLAIKEGKFKSLNYLIEKQESILSEKDSGIFRMTTEISSLEVFKTTLKFKTSPVPACTKTASK